MAGADAQAGFYYQNLIAALHVLDAIEFGSPIKSISLENPARAKHVDDIIVDHIEGTDFIQVKWTEDESSSMTLANLIASEEDGISLFKKIARGYLHVSNQSGKKNVILFSTRRAGTNRQPASGFEQSLAEFITEFHSPFIIDTSLTEVTEVESYGKFQKTIERLAAAARLQDLKVFSKFLKSLRFSLNQPNRETISNRLRGRLESLGVEQRQFGTLLDEVVKWSISGEFIYAEDVLRVLGLRDRFSERLSHHFPVESAVWVPTPVVFQALDESLKSLSEGFILVEGEPGSGKSTALTKYLSERKDIIFGYYCFVPGDRILGNERLGEAAFVRSICIGLKNAFRDFDFPTPYAEQTVGLLNSWLFALSGRGRRVVFMVDGVDHVHRKTRQSLIAHSLTAIFDGHLPPNVLIVLSSRYSQALPHSVVSHIQGDARRHIQVPRFGREQVARFLSLRGIGLAEKLFDAAVRISGGVPIYLEYLASQLANMTAFEQERYLQSAPTLRDNQIDHVHQHLWEQCEQDERLIYVLAILAVREEFTTPETLQTLLNTLGHNATLVAVHQALAKIRHVLRTSDAKGVAIRHSSLAEFVSERTTELRNEITRAILRWYADHPTADEAWRHQFRHLFEAKEFEAILAACDDEWVNRAWAFHRPMTEIQRNLDIAWHAASCQRNLVAFLRIALLKQQGALIDQNLGLSESELSRLLLDIGLTDHALNRVWDGERRTVDITGFAEFALQHVLRTGRVLPGQVLRAGLADGPLSSRGIEGARAWYRANAYVGDAKVAVNDIARLEWRTKAQYGHSVDRADVDENQRINLELQLDIVKELADKRDLRELHSLTAYEDIPPSLRAAAHIAVSVVLARLDEVEEASSTLVAIALNGLPTAYVRWAYLELAKKGVHKSLQIPPLSTPVLPPKPVQEHDFNTKLLDLYDEFRQFFVADVSASIWLDSALTGIPQPMRTIISAISAIANIWTSFVQRISGGRDLLSELKTVCVRLDVDSRLFAKDEGGFSSDHRLYAANASQLYNQVWSCACATLPNDQLLELARWWLQSSNGRRCCRYPGATRSLALIVAKNAINASELVLRELLESEERQARVDEETTTLTSALVESARAWGLCGFAGEAQRLWKELAIAACGVYSRKDYQFSEVLTALELVHLKDPVRTIDRLREQLSLIRQLEETGNAKQVSIPIERILAFIAKNWPSLALSGLKHEEPFIFRERAIHGITEALLEAKQVDRRLILAIVSTMGRWENYRHFNDETRIAMYALFVATLDAEDYDGSRRVYDFARQILLVEKQMPRELARWADAWVRCGTAPSDVLSDLESFGATGEVTELQEQAIAQDNSYPQVELDEIALQGISVLECHLDEAARVEVLKDRVHQLERSHEGWHRAAQKAVSELAWDEQQTAILNERLNEFHIKVAGKLELSSLEAREAIQGLLPDLAEMLSSDLSAVVDVEVLRAAFDVDAWLNEIVQPSRLSYRIDRKLRGHLQNWIAKAPFADLHKWEAFCHLRCSEETRASGLLAIAERLERTRPIDAFSLLRDAQRSIADFFFEHTRLSGRICEKAIQLDHDHGLDLVFESFRTQYQRFPQSIIYRLDTLLVLFTKTSNFDTVALYEVWTTHNRRLAAGLSTKAAHTGWLDDDLVDDNFESACVRYLIDLLKYPNVDVRLLATEALYNLVREHDGAIAQIKHYWASCADCQKELIASIFDSLGRDRPETAPLWANWLIARGTEEAHYNIRATIASAVGSPAVAAVTEQEPSKVESLIEPPLLARILQEPVLSGTESGIRLPPYHAWSVDRMSKISSEYQFEDLVLSFLAVAYPNPKAGLEEEFATHREHNINSNFDNIEIAAQFDEAARSAINRAVWALNQAHAVNNIELRRNADLLRLRDPTDSLVKRVERPPQINWIDSAVSDTEFLEFADISELSIASSCEHEEWMILFEYTEQRIGSSLGSDTQRACQVRIEIFGLPHTAMPLILGAHNGSFSPRLLCRRNLYRFELGSLVSPTSPSGAVPLVVATKRAFRGRQTGEIAAISDHWRQVMPVSVSLDDLLGNCIDGVKVVRSTEWQEAFDQGRRRQEPRSSGFLLEVRRDILTRLAEQLRVELWAWVGLKRTTDRYKPEHMMQWNEYEAVIPLKINEAVSGRAQ